MNNVQSYELDLRRSRQGEKGTSLRLVGRALHSFLLMHLYTKKFLPRKFVAQILTMKVETDCPQVFAKG